MTDTNPIDTLTEREALDMRKSILAAGLDFRDVYTELGIEVETKTTPAQMIEVAKRIMAAGAPTEAPKTLLAALHAVQAEIPDLELTKDATNPAFKSKFLSLTKIMAQALPLLNKHGLVFTTLPGYDNDKNPVLNYELVFVKDEGEWDSLSGVFPLLLDKNNSQGLGSAITYARRYALTALLGLTPDEDDDGQAASTSEVPSRKMTAIELNKMREALIDAGLEKRRVLTELGFDLTKTPTLDQGKLVKAYIEEHGNA